MLFPAVLLYLSFHMDLVFGVCAAARPAWLLPGEQVNKQVSECSCERERDSLLNWVISPWVWDGPGAFLKQPINFQSFCALLMSLLLSQLISFPG